MEISHKKIGIGQLNIFDLIKEISHRQAEASAISKAGTFNIDVRLRAMLSDALKRCPLSRHEVAGKMSELLGVEISKSQLDSWTAESKENHRFPFAYAAAFCVATGDKAIVRLIAELCDGYFIESEDALRLELGRIEEMKQELQKREQAIRDFLVEIKRGGVK